MEMGVHLTLNAEATAAQPVSKPKEPKEHENKDKHDNEGENQQTSNGPKKVVKLVYSTICKPI